MKTLRFLPLFSAIAMACILSGCIKGEESDTSLIGMAFRSRTSPWWETATEEATVQAALLKQPYFLANADSASQQMPQLTKMVAASVQALILSDQGVPVDSIKKFIGAGIPVILLDCSMEVDYACRITGDNAAAGTEAGNYIQQHLPTAHPVTLIIGVKAALTDSIRREACKKVLTGSVIESFVTSYTQTAGKEAMTSALELSNADQIGAVYTTDDELALGVLSALTEKANTTVTTLVGCGGSQSFLETILSTTDRNLATAVYSPLISKQCVEIAYQLIHNNQQPDPKEVSIAMPLVDRSNAEKYRDPNASY